MPCNTGDAKSTNKPADDYSHDTLSNYERVETLCSSAYTFPSFNKAS